MPLLFMLDWNAQPTTSSREKRNHHFRACVYVCGEHEEVHKYLLSSRYFMRAEQKASWIRKKEKKPTHFILFHLVNAAKEKVRKRSIVTEYHMYTKKLITFYTSHKCIHVRYRMSVHVHVYIMHTLLSHYFCRIAIYGAYRHFWLEPNTCLINYT